MDIWVDGRSLPCNGLVGVSGWDSGRQVEEGGEEIYKAASTMTVSVLAMPSRVGSFNAMSDSDVDSVVPAC